MSIPSCTSNAQICNKCYTAQNPSNACTSSSSSNSSNNEQACSVYCDTGCNTSCLTSQAYCSLNHQLISSVAGSYPIKEVCGASNESCGYSQYDRIDTTWSATNWNSLITQIEKAENAGEKVSQGSGGTAKSAKSNEPITLEHYNDIITKLNHFKNTSLTKATRDNNQDIITATKANALRSGYNNANFSTDVCDICNAGNEAVGGTCGCNCSCSCSCNCGCSCPCNCSCPCGCSSPCSNPQTSGS